MLLLLNLLVDYIVLWHISSQLDNDLLECLDLALLDVDLGLRLLKQSLQLRDRVLPVYLRLVLDVARTLTESKG